jgi:hypothetical protein
VPENTMQLPPAWAADTLTAFLDNAQKNTHATFHRKKPAFNILQNIDDCFLKIGTNLLNPQNQIAPLFLFRSFSAYRATCGAAMAGQFTESFALARLCIEYAGYGLFLHNDAKRVPIWFDKGKGAAEKKAFRTAFTQTNVRDCIQTYDAKLAQVYDDLYQRTIDTGAHPNELGVSGSMKITDDSASGTVHIQQIFLQADGIQLEYSLKSAAQIGICSLHLFQWIFKERFSLLGISERLADLRQNYGL